MKHILLIFAVVMGQSVMAADEKPLITNPIVEKAIRELTKADLAKVTLLSLDDGPKITDADLKELAKLQQLKVLDLEATQITDVGLKELAKLQQLTLLSLAATKITDTGLKDVAKLQKLKMLYLDNTKFTKVGVAVLKKALPKCKIEGP